MNGQRLAMLAADYGRRVKEMRTRWQMSQTQLGESLGLDTPTICRIEHGEAVATGEAAVVLDRQLRWHEAVGILQPGGNVTLPDNRTPHARASDPAQSHEVVASIANDQTLADAILDVADRVDTFNVTELHAMLTGPDYQRSNQRNVVARSVSLLEQDGRLVKVGVEWYEPAGRRLNVYTKGS